MPRTGTSSDPKIQALLTFIDTIEVTGGIREQGDGMVVPIADEDWIDLGEAYLQACNALDHPPKYAR
jgi:hypothetical protein